MHRAELDGAVSSIESCSKNMKEKIRRQVFKGAFYQPVSAQAQTLQAIQESKPTWDDETSQKQLQGLLKLSSHLFQKVKIGNNEAMSL